MERMLNAKKWSKLTYERVCRSKPRFIFFLVPGLLVLTVYIVTGREIEFESFLSLRGTYGTEDQSAGDAEIMNGYLVWNPKCHMLSKDPWDSSIKKFAFREKFQSCGSSSPEITSHVEMDPSNGSMLLTINDRMGKKRKNMVCCWTPISRPVPSRPPKGDWDTKISVGKCERLTSDRAYLPEDLEIAMIQCRRGKTTIYENIHAIINRKKVEDRLSEATGPKDSKETKETTEGGEEGNKKKSRKLSILMLGIDSVSRLNFARSLPKTADYLSKKEFHELRGYNKMGENTFPNLMAILTGLNESAAYARCKPTIPFGLDECPMLWYSYRNASYVTSYGEELSTLSTFNYGKKGFVEPPTDYYLRPYVLATEKLLKSKKRFGAKKYCTGSEISVERIFNYAIEFAKTFLGSPYFGFFWTNSVSHDDANGISSMDERMKKIFKNMEDEGIFNDSMIVFLSDHGARWGGIRNTFVGWLEDRLPFIYVRLPDWYRLVDPNADRALRINENRLTSPYDLYMTLRDILQRSEGSAEVSLSCSTCQSLFLPIPKERGCRDAGISPHWCTCAAFETASTRDEIALRGTDKFLQHIENIIKHYKNEKGERLCARLKLNKILRVDSVIDRQRQFLPVNETGSIERSILYLIEVSPGGALYEATIHYRGQDIFIINEDEVSRINSYSSTSGCLDHGSKRYCHCLSKS